MKELQVFNNLEFGKVRMVVVKDKPYAVGNDIAKVLEYKRPYEAVTSHCKGTVTYRVPTNGGSQDVKIIPEGDIYRLIVKAADQSKNLEIKEKAARFERWIFDEVIPSIRKHGAYMTPETIEKILLNPDTIIKLAKEIKQEREARIKAEKQIEQQAPLVGFAETCLTSKDSILIRELAKVASKQGIKIGQNRLYEKLRDWGLILQGKTEPYQSAIEAGYFEVKQGTKDTSYGNMIYRTTKVTPKGQVYIIEKLKKELAIA